jgi:predicted nuclease of restriction endonuclease-like (RecB) superfamily
MTELTEYAGLLADIKTRIQAAQTRAVLAVNAELIHLYWEIGRLLDARQATEGWGAGVIPRLAQDIRNELPEVKGFSARNVDRMLAFARAYPEPADFSPQPVAKLPGTRSSSQAEAPMPAKATPKVPQAVAQTPATPSSPQAVAKTPGDSLLWQVPWGHHALLLEKVKPLPARRWYMAQTLAQGWSRNTLMLMIDSDAHTRQGAGTSNFTLRLPAPQSDLVQQALKDPYVFDFLTLEEPFHERELETGLVRHLEKFLLELGQGFAFMGRQHRITVADQDFYLDLLFFHVRLRCYVVIELKRGEFKPEYAGKMNFYCNLVDDQLRHPDDAPTIGLILCQRNNDVLAEYALRGVDKPIGVSTFDLTRALPATLASVLPSIEAIEAELSGAAKNNNNDDPA